MRRRRTARMTSGGNAPVSPGTTWWFIADTAAKFAAAKQAEIGVKLEYKQLVQVELQPVAGSLFHVTFTAVDCTDQVEKIYKADVVDRPWLKFYEETLTLCSFETFSEDSKTAEKMRLEVTAKFEELEKKGWCRPTPGVEQNIARIKPKRGRIAAQAFIIFLKNIKSENPEWKYAKVRKVASKQWKAMHPTGWFIGEAERQFEQKYNGGKSSIDDESGVMQEDK